jgi:hypothetical protein
MDVRIALDRDATMKHLSIVSFLILAVAVPSFAQKFCRQGTAAPSIRGVRLGMPMKEFRELYPNLEITSRKQYGLKFKIAGLSGGKYDARYLQIWFLNETVEMMSPNFTSLKGARNLPDFYRRVATAIGLLEYFEPDGTRWKCDGFSIEVLTNEEPTINIRSKAFEEFRSKLNDGYMKRL